MKKMMTALAVALIAGLTQAASVDWAITGANPIKTTSNGNPSTSLSVYLVLDGYQNSIVTAIENGTFKVSTTGIVGADVTTPGGGHNLSAKTATHDSLKVGQSYSYVVLVFNEAYTGVGGSQGYYQFSGVLGPMPTYISGTDPERQVTFTSGEFDSTNWKDYTVTPVPEPTSAALLALGVAALGLRRRFRK